MRHLKMHNHYLPAHIDCILVVKEPSRFHRFGEYRTEMDRNQNAKYLRHQLDLQLHRCLATRAIPVEAPFQICWDKMWAKEKFGDKA